jgi:tetratricopeptide (TPR) repeat protein
MLRDALALWRGPALEEFAWAPFAPLEVQRLEELRLAGVEARVSADLAAGRHALLVSELQQMTAQHPSREVMHGYLMLALYRTGRQAEALAAYRRARSVLVERFGIEPGHELRELQRAILEQDPALDPPRATGAVSTDTVTEAEGLLERSGELSALEDHLAAVTGSGRGRLVLIAGEAGVGKSALVHAFCAGRAAVQVLSGACEPLYTPRPLGPFLDIAHDAGGELAALAREEATPGALVEALMRYLRERPPAILVLEDLHWADEATLDVVRLLARRVEGLPILLLVTYRDDQLDRTHPVRVVLGEIPPSDSVCRLAIPPLSEDAVQALAGVAAVDAGELHRRTGGNAFFVSEVLAAGGTEIPVSVRDAVLARAARLNDEARALLDAVAVVPPRAELWLLEALVDPRLEHLDTCLASGMLRSERDAVAFRHEIARVAVEDDLPPHRRVHLHRRAAAALAAVPGGRLDLARLTHHADAAGDADAVLRYAPAAGERAAALGAHREAAAQFARALRYADGLGPERRAALLDRRAYECYLTNAIGEAIVAREEAMEQYRARGDRLREGDSHRWLSRLAWFEADNARAEHEAERAVELLETQPPGRELAMAYSNMAQLRMLAGERSEAATWGGRAIELAERLDETEILIHALNNVGAAELAYDSPDGVPMLERSLELAHAAGLQEHVARAHTNLGSLAVHVRDYALADRHLDNGIAYCVERDLDSWRLYMAGWKSRSEFEQGRWAEAERTARMVLEHPNAAPPSRITPLAVLGRLRARCRASDVWDPLDEALELAERTGELQRLAPVAVARAEAGWLTGVAEQVAGETDKAFALAAARKDPWLLGELWAWRRRAGLMDDVDAEDLPGPFRLELQRAWQAAAEMWSGLGCPYEQALALVDAREEQALRRGLAELQRLGAHATASRVAVLPPT